MVKLIGIGVAAFLVSMAAGVGAVKMLGGSEVDLSAALAEGALGDSAHLALEEATEAEGLSYPELLLDSLVGISAADSTASQSAVPAPGDSAGTIPPGSAGPASSTTEPDGAAVGSGVEDPSIAAAEESRLGRIFASMQPREAARVLEQMEDADVVAILGMLRERQAAAVLASLSPQRAAAISKAGLGAGTVQP